MIIILCSKTLNPTVGQGIHITMLYSPVLSLLRMIFSSPTDLHHRGTSVYSDWFRKYRRNKQGGKWSIKR